jgi:hypothetical protein
VEDENRELSDAVLLDIARCVADGNQIIRGGHGSRFSRRALFRPKDVFVSL